MTRYEQYLSLRSGIQFPARSQAEMLRQRTDKERADEGAGIAKVGREGRNKRVLK